MRARAVLAAPAAAAWLEHPRGGRVLHFFERVVNLVDEQGRVLSLHRSGVELSPLAARVEAASGGGALPDFGRLVDAAAPVAVEGARLSVGRLLVDFSAVQRWESRPPWERIAPAAVLRGRRRMAGPLLRAAPAGSLAALLDGGATDSRPLVPFGRAARDLARGMVDDNVGLARAAASSLAGCGPGLTPAGDDFLVGALLALWAAGRARTQTELIAAIVQAAVPRTGSLPGAWIAAAARGEAAESWHRLLAALGQEDGQEIAAVTADIARVGHTSGADTLTGFLVALDAFEPIDRVDRSTTIAATGHDR